jgi:hypothetical protein
MQLQRRTVAIAKFYSRKKIAIAHYGHIHM